MDSNLYISALQRQPCLLKTNSTRVLVTWLVTLLLIICPSSYKARLNNLIGTADIEPQIISPQWSNARPNFPTKKCVGGAKFGLVSRLQKTLKATVLILRTHLSYWWLKQSIHHYSKLIISVSDCTKYYGIAFTTHQIVSDEECRP